MKISELPPSTRLGITASYRALCELLRRECRFAGRTRFTHFTVIKNGKSSGRVFFFGPHPDAVELPKGRDAEELAQELLDFASREARYPEDGDGARGWELRNARIGDQPAVIAWATWVKSGSL